MIAMIIGSIARYAPLTIARYSLRVILVFSFRGLFFLADGSYHLNPSTFISANEVSVSSPSSFLSFAIIYFSAFSASARSPAVSSSVL